MFSHIKELFTRPSGYQISRSVRLRSSASAYFNRTPASAGNRQTWTWSSWVKRGALGGSSFILQTFGSAGFGIQGSIAFVSDTLDFVFDYNAGSRWRLITTAVYKDPSAWYHVVVVADTTNATSTDRLRIYVNGVRVTAFSTANYPTQNANGTLNQAYSHAIGADTTPSTFFDGYMTEINFIDGQALTPSSFGETNTVTGVWQPKAYSGTYGTNGFYLNFSDNSGVTATTIGKDYSGNGNNWTPNNISVTAGATYDSMLDVPTLYADGGNGRGNYPVWNPLVLSTGTFSSANLNVSTATTNATSTTIFASTGKWYWEVVCTSATVTNTRFGIVNTSGAGTDLGGNANGWAYLGDGRVYHNGASSSYGVSYATNDILMIALDVDAGKIWYGKNGTWMASGVPSTGTSPSQTFTANQLMSPAVASGSGTFAYVLNCGQRPFTYTPPTGFVALNTQNLPTPTISNGAGYMAATTYTGTGSALTIANTVGSASFQPDLVWVKGRSGATDHAWYDAVRGVQLQLESNTTTAETTETTGLTAFGSTGFTVGALAQMNTNTATYVAWQWNAGGSTVTNTSGSISSQVRANATAGFSVVTYTGNATNGASYGHGLGVAPSMVITKARSGANDWATYHVSLGSNQYLFLNQTAAAATFSGWLTPSANVNTFTNTSSGVNTSGATYVAYCFAAVAGYSAFGKYTGNGSADGPFVFTNFRPRWVMIKRTDTAGYHWYIWDTSRNTFNVMDKTQYANDPTAEITASDLTIDALANGFKLRGTSLGINANGGTYVYMAFCENPFKLSLAR